jgi:hypothetical protein
MYYDIRLLKKEEYPLLNNLAKTVNLRETLDLDCDFIGAKQEGNLIAVAGINFKRERYPQFEHIILRQDVRNRKLLILLCRQMERYIKDKGYDVYVSYITNDMNDMQVYALKWGMEAYSNDLHGVWFYKKITEG